MPMLRPIDVVAGFEEVEAAVDIEDTLTDQRSSEHQRLHRGVMARMRRDPILVALAAFAERALLDAQRADSASHALEAEVAVALDLHRDAVVVTLYRNRVMKTGGVALDADEERVRWRRVVGQAEVGEDVGSGFAAQYEFFDGSVFVVSFPEGMRVEVDPFAFREADEFADFGS